MLQLIQEINTLWETVYPHLARHIAEVYGRRGGTLLEAGPFCGVIYDLVRQNMGNAFLIASFPAGMKGFYDGETLKRGMDGSIDVVESSQSLTGIDDESVDLVVFRGALFFPSLFQVDYPAIRRVLRPGGVAFVGGGFGRHTPAEVIRPIAQRSRELNLRIGKVEAAPEMIRQDLKASDITDNYEIVTEGGLWIVLKK